MAFSILKAFVPVKYLCAFVSLKCIGVPFAASLLASQLTTLSLNQPLLCMHFKFYIHTKVLQLHTIEELLKSIRLVYK